jgi:hypothetical protein
MSADRSNAGECACCGAFERLAATVGDEIRRNVRKLFDHVRIAACRHDQLSGSRERVDKACNLRRDRESSFAFERPRVRVHHDPIGRRRLKRERIEFTHG